MSSRQAWSTDLVLGQPELLHREILGGGGQNNPNRQIQNKFKKIKIATVFSSHSGKKIKSNSKRNSGKFKTMWEFSNRLNKQWVKTSRVKLENFFKQTKTKQCRADWTQQKQQQSSQRLRHQRRKPKWSQPHHSGKPEKANLKPAEGIVIILMTATIIIKKINEEPESSRTGIFGKEK